MKTFIILNLIIVFIFLGCTNKRTGIRVNGKGNGAVFMKGDIYKF